VSLTRRQLLRAAGASSLAAALFPWTARAGDPPPTRLILFYTPHGTIRDRWLPAGSETSWSLSPILKPLAAHKSRMVVVDGLRIANPYSHRVPHTYDFPALWSGSPIDVSTPLYTRPDHGVSFGWNTGTSIDQHLANLTNPDTRFKSLELGVLCGGAHPATRMIYAGPAAPRHPLDTPQRAWDQIFGSLSTDAATLARKRAVLDMTIGEMASLRGTLSAADRVRLDAHAESLRDIERTLENQGGDCEVPDRPLDLGLERVIDQQSDLLASALGCGLTRFASLQVRIADNDGSLYPWAGIASDGHHAISHVTTQAAYDTLAELYTWYAARFAYLLDRLAAWPDADGASVLDNSLVVWGTEIGRGWDHLDTDVPFVVAGGAGGRLRGNRFLQKPRTVHNRLLVSLAHGVGVPEVERFGTNDDGGGPLSGLIG
jgi:hypothetical protein